ncbi:MAG: hypothetical protein PVH61_08895 [Candidatus Aminicenantes bacterium]|jgi:hypothetical protein
MIQDPEMSWEDDFPYDVLAPAGITPYSSIREVQASMGYFIDQNMVEETQTSRNLLRQVKNRLFYDFFFYREKWPGMKENTANNKNNR